MSFRLPAGSKSLYDEVTISRALDEVAARLTERCVGKSWLVLSVMNGGLLVTAELLKRLKVELKLDHLKVSRYHERTSGNELIWHSYPATDLRGQHVLLIDDIFDEGATLAALVDYCYQAGAVSVVSAVLLLKAHDRTLTDYRPDEVGIVCPDYYVFGFGMDYEGYFRNLPAIFYLAE